MKKKKVNFSQNSLHKLLQLEKIIHQPDRKEMPSNQTENLTRMLKEAQSGKRETLDEFLPLVYDELKKIAGYKLASERSNHTLQATALVHEAYLRLIDQHSVDWQNRAHFFAIASEMMRRILVNHAEAHNAKKRGDGKTLISLDDAEHFAAEPEVDLIFLDNALDELAEFDKTQAKIVELKFFGGLTNEEAAEVLGISESTIKREWRMARAWLTTKLT